RGSGTRPTRGSRRPPGVAAVRPAVVPVPPGPARRRSRTASTVRPAVRPGSARADRRSVPARARHALAGLGPDHLVTPWSDAHERDRTPDERGEELQVVTG